MTTSQVVHERYPTCRAFLAALHEFWGSRAFVQNGHDPAVFHARCPSCTASGDHPSERFVIDVETHEDGGWRLSTVRCGCSGESILAALERALASRHADAASHYAARARGRIADDTRVSGGATWRRERLRAATLAAARAQGCACEPQITMRELEPGVWNPTVAHDDWCPLLRSHEGTDATPPPTFALVSEAWLGGGR